MEFQSQFRPTGTDLLAINCKRQFSRRMLFGTPLLLLLFRRTAVAQPKLGGDEWMRSFRAYVKFFNAFVESLNDGRFDVSNWRQMRRTWREIDFE